MRSINSRRRLIAGVATVSLAAVAVAGGALALTASADSPASFSGIVLGIGTDEKARNLSWYTTGTAAEEVQLSTDKTFSDATTTKIPATLAANTSTTGIPADNGKVTLSVLQPQTTYYYRVAETGTSNVSKAYAFHTQTFGAGDYDFLFFGDPQIGSSGDAVRDGDGWADTLSVATALNPNAELLVSGGDQVETANTEAHWDNFLRSDKLRQYPWAATIGNHDVSGIAYQQHFNVPNLDDSDALYTNAANKAKLSGGDYWYTYKGVLFIDLNSNAYSAANGSDPAHVQFVTKVVNAHPDAQYTVLVYHHSIYSPADHANDSDNIQRRTDFTTAFSSLGVDLVLQGHDHSYTRSYVIRNGAKADPSEPPGAPSVVTGPGGVIYVTANSASGSKYYDLTQPDATKGGYGADPLDTTDPTKGHVRHWANSVENQEHVRTFVKVQVRSDKLVVENVRASDCSGPNAAVERGNVSWCGPSNGADAALPVGSFVDQVQIHLTAPSETTQPPAGGGQPPVVTVLSGGTPKVTGNAKVGKRLKVRAGSWTSGARLTYQWLKNGKKIKGATSSSLKVTKKLRGKKVSVKVTGSLAGATPSSLVRTSAAVKVKT